MSSRCVLQLTQLLPSVLGSRSPAVGESSPEEETQRADEGSVRAPSPLVHGRISSDDSDSEVHEETLDFQSSAAHPRPLAVSISGAGVGSWPAIELRCSSDIQISDRWIRGFLGPI